MCWCLIEWYMSTVELYKSTVEWYKSTVEWYMSTVESNTVHLNTILDRPGFDIR
jgi:dissimilatory sulfite reductase (desulfoviridin) alpha/beta subunit